MLRNMYDRVIALSESRHALPTLAAVSFAESSFFPIPPDVILVPMALARPEKATTRSSRDRPNDARAAARSLAVARDHDESDPR